MKKAFIIFANTCKRSRAMTMAALCCGIALCFLFGFMDSMISDQYAGVPIGVSAHEETAVTRDLRAYLTDELGMDLTESDDVDYLNTELVERHIAAVVEVPSGFEAGLLAGRPLKIEARFLDDYANAIFVRGYLESYTASLAALAAGAESSPVRLEEMITAMRSSMAQVETVSPDPSSLVAVAQQNAFRQVLGFFLMLAFLLGLVSAMQLFDDRQMGLYHRVKASDVNTVQYLVGTCSVGLFNAAVLIAPFFAYMLISQPSTGMRLWQAASLCLLYALFVVGVALALATHLETKNSMTFSLIGLATITCLLGGAYFPIDTSPVFLQRLARATPQYWFVDAVNSLQEDAHASWWLNVVVIALFALLCFILAGIRFVAPGRKKSA